MFCVWICGCCVGCPPLFCRLCAIAATLCVMLCNPPSVVGISVFFPVLCMILSTCPAFTVARLTILTFESVKGFLFSFEAICAKFFICCWLAYFSNLQFRHFADVELLWAVFWKVSWDLGGSTWFWLTTSWFDIFGGVNIWFGPGGLWIWVAWPW